MELGSMFRLSLSDLEPAPLRGIKKDLTVHQRGGEKYGFGKGQTVALFHEHDGMIEIPRWYALREISPRGFEDMTSEGQPALFDFIRPLRPNQEPVIRDFFSKIGKRGSENGGIVSAPCGSGKTVMALKILSEMKRTAIVLVHAEFLVKQWKEAILGSTSVTPPLLPFTNLKPEDVGIIQQDDCEWQGKKIVLAMVETLINREYAPDFYRYFGVAVLDEVHRHSAAKWHQAMTKFPAKFRVGLSATPSRSDGLWNVVRYHVGNVIAQGDESEKATVWVVPTGVHVHDEFYKKTDANGEETDNIMLARLLKVLCKSDFRNRLIADEVFKAVQAGRRVLVLSDRLAHLDEIEKFYKEHLPAEERMAAEMAGDPLILKIGRYVGGISGEELERAKDCVLLFGTYQYAKEGLDDPMLDTLFLTTPKGDVTQAVGRILRVAEGKKPPLVVDFLDEKTDACNEFFERRMRRYSSKNYDVKKIEKRA